MEHEKELLNAKETAAYFGMSRTTLWRRTRIGALPAPVRIAGLTRWRRSDLVAFLNELSGNHVRIGQ